MLRGIQKRMIVCKPPSGSRFECAYFVLRDEKDVPAQDKEALMREVRQLLAEGERRKKKSKDSEGARTLRRTLWLFFGGMVCGAFPFALLLIFS